MDEVREYYNTRRRNNTTWLPLLLVGLVFLGGLFFFNMYQNPDRTNQSVIPGIGGGPANSINNTPISPTQSTNMTNSTSSATPTPTPTISIAPTPTPSSMNPTL